MAVDDEFTKSLLHFEDAGNAVYFPDESGKTWNNFGNARIATGQYKFGVSSCYFDGNGDYIISGNSEDFNFGTGDFTIDGWIYRAGTKAYPGIIGSNIGGGSGWAIRLGNSDNKFIWYSNGAVKITTAGTIADTTWTHFAVIRYINTVTVYIGGTADGTDDCTGDTISTDSSGVCIGRMSPLTDNYYWNGYIRFFKD